MFFHWTSRIRPLLRYDDVWMLYLRGKMDTLIIRWSRGVDLTLILGFRTWLSILNSKQTKLILRSLVEQVKYRHVIICHTFCSVGISNLRVCSQGFLIYAMHLCRKVTNDWVSMHPASKTYVKQFQQFHHYHMFTCSKAGPNWERCSCYMCQETSLHDKKTTSIVPPLLCSNKETHPGL